MYRSYPAPRIAPREVHRDHGDPSRHVRLPNAIDSNTTRRIEQAKEMNTFHCSDAAFADAASCSIALRRLNGRMSVRCSSIYARHSSFVPCLPTALHPVGIFL